MKIYFKKSAKINRRRNNSPPFFLAVKIFWRWFYSKQKMVLQFSITFVSNILFIDFKHNKQGLFMETWSAAIIFSGLLYLLRPYFTYSKRDHTTRVQKQKTYMHLYTGTGIYYLN
jgi:hypothetical protein